MPLPERLYEFGALPGFNVPVTVSSVLTTALVVSKVTLPLLIVSVRKVVTAAPPSVWLAPPAKMILEEVFVGE